LRRESDISATEGPAGGPDAPVLTGPVELAAGSGDDGRRLDLFLAGRLPQLSRSRLQHLVREGHLRQGGRVIAEPGYRVKPGEGFVLDVPPPTRAEPAAQELPLELLFEDEHLIVLVKPAGVVVHPAPGHAEGTLVNALLAHCEGSLSGIGGVLRPGIVHRLDREVSGVMVAAKHDRAHIGLAGQFSVHSIERVYEAIVWGLPQAKEGTVDRPVGRHPVDRKRMAVVRRGGKRAVTHWRVLAAAGTRAAHLALRLETGRTHQIRVHTSSLGHPIVGDRLYGRGRDAQAPAAAAATIKTLDRILLHARHLGFIHPVTGQAMAFDVPPPEMFPRVLELLRG
jgi:23S rRNA pseudouridine1911/1915/1917 synthase